MKLDKIFFILLGAIIIFQFSFFGLKYFEVADDNNQLGVFNILNDNIYENVIDHYKSYNVRPLAFISDSYIFQWFWDNMYALLAIILILHVYSIFLLYKICERIDIKLNAFCLILFALSPMLVEGLYWISASTRIVISLFLSLASIHLLLKYFDEERKKYKIIYLVASIVLNLLCVGYYEQTIALNLFLFSFVMICLKKYKYITIPIASTTWIGAWYIYFMMNGKMQERGALDFSGILSSVKDLISKVYVYYKNAYTNFLYSINLGKEEFFSNIMCIIFVALIIGFIYYIFKNKCNKDENKSIFKKIILGIIFFVVPFLPFVVLKSVILAVRNFYLPTLGLSIFLGVCIDLILKLVKNETICNILKTGSIGIIMFLFIFANIDGVNDYRKVNLIDNKIIKQIVSAVDSNDIEEKKTLSLNYDFEKLYKYKNLTNYVQCIIESDWAAMGKIQVYRDSHNVGMVYINSMQEEADYTLYFDDEMNLINTVKKVNK